MTIFEKVSEIAKSIMSEWIEVGDPTNNRTIEDFPNGVNESNTNRHCWRCVTINRCWFKNEEDKKPKEFDYSKYSINQISLSKRGLYHPNCHDIKKSINVPKEKDIEILELRKKFNDFFKRKKNLFYGIGYSYKDEKDIMNNYIYQVKNLFRYGKYSTFKHWEYGFQINIIITIFGKNEFKNKSHNFKSGLFIYPNGKLKIVTIFAGGIN